MNLPIEVCNYYVILNRVGCVGVITMQPKGQINEHS